MKKTIITAIIAAASISAVSQTFSYGDLRYRITGKTTVSVSADDPKMSGNVAIPERIMQDSVVYTVTSVERKGFADCKGISSIVLPARISSIGDSAFAGCENLNTINIPYAVKEIKGNTFENCRFLTGITVPDGVKSIGNSAFSYCERLIRFIVPDECISIGDNAFYGCSRMQAFAVNSKLEKIGNSALGRCIGIVRFQVEQGNPNFICVDEALVWKTGGKTIFLKYPSKRRETSYRMPDDVTEVAEYAFEDVESLALVQLNGKCEALRDYAFFSCTSLQKITRPEGHVDITEDSIFGCPLLTFY